MPSHPSSATGQARLEKDLAVLEYVESQVLQPGETIAWRGRPDPISGLLVNAHRTVALIAVWGLVGYLAIEQYESGLLHLLVLAVAAAGLLLSLAPLRNYSRACNTYYAITSRRVLIITADKGHRVTDILPQAISNIEIKDKGDGSGSIALTTTLVEDNEGASWRETRFENGLWGIQDLKGAMDALARLELDWAT